eukprot:TRINITY_DN6084_c0_g1_i1.p1 TRINITY_DN6084_c0_g1~~TRINITY_DN6084_c0_g1_i1.p1  ORF type:complete len:215 (-),score=61.87 TRINITY_DN6084_c0_g1_i1:72-716(-)
MSNLFGGGSQKKDPGQTAARNAKRELKRSERDLDRELMNLDRQEKQTLLEIKKYAKSGDKTSARSLSKQIVRIRDQKTKLRGMKSQVKAVGFQTTTIQANAAMSRAMVGATKAMTLSNAQMKPEELMATMRNYELQNEHMAMKEEMLEDLFDDDEEEEEIDELFQQVCEDIGLDLKAEFVKTPQSSLQQETVGASAASVGLSDEERLLQRITAL